MHVSARTSISWLCVEKYINVTKYVVRKWELGPQMFGKTHKFNFDYWLGQTHCLSNATLQLRILSRKVGKIWEGQMPPKLKSIFSHLYIPQWISLCNFSRYFYTWNGFDTHKSIRYCLTVEDREEREILFPKTSEILKKSWYMLSCQLPKNIMYWKINFTLYMVWIWILFRPYVIFGS